MIDRNEALARVLQPDHFVALLYAGAIAGFPAAAALPTLIGVDSRLATVPYRAAMLVVACCVIGRWVVQPRTIQLGGYAALLAIVWSLLLVRMAFDFNVQPLPLFLAPADYFAIAIGTCLIPAVAVLETPGPSTIRLAWKLALLVAVMALFGILVMLWRDGLAGLWSERLSTNVINPVTLGHLGTSLCLLVVAVPPGVMPASRPLRGFWRIALVAVFVSGLALAIASASRGPLLAVILGVVAFELFKRPGSIAGSLLKRGVPMLLLLVGVGALALVLVEHVTGLRPLERITNIADESNTERGRLASAAWRQFMENPWVGDALVERVELNYPHNVLIESAMATGVVGLLAMCGLLALVVRSVVQVLHRRPDARWIALIAGQGLLLALLSGSMLQSDLFWIYSSAVVAVAGRSAVVSLNTAGARSGKAVQDGSWRLPAH